MVPGSRFPVQLESLYDKKRVVVKLNKEALGPFRLVTRGYFPKMADPHLLFGNVLVPGSRFPVQFESLSDKKKRVGEIKKRPWPPFRLVTRGYFFQKWQTLPCCSRARRAVGVGKRGRGVRRGVGSDATGCAWMARGWRVSGA